MTLRQDETLRDIVNDITNDRKCTKELCKKYNDWCGKCQEDRICSAIDKTAKGMLLDDMPFYESDRVSREPFQFGKKMQLEMCQAYWQKELGK